MNFSKKTVFVLLAAAAGVLGDEQTCSLGDLQALRTELWSLMNEQHCNPIMVRLAWHDSGTYDDSVGVAQWPKCGGANGSIRFQPEINHGANAGLNSALELLAPIKEKFQTVSWSDVIQMASAVAVEHAGGPKIPMRYGRVDVETAEECAREGNLPDGNAPFGDGSPSPESHLRRVFHRMGLDDRDITALSGAHTLGRARHDRSGAGKEFSKYTQKATDAPLDPADSGAKDDFGLEGGSSWTRNWLKFDNSYFTTLLEQSADSDLLRLETDMSLFQDEGFKRYADVYAKDEQAFFDDYQQAHKKLSELGSKFIPAEGVYM